MEIFESLLFYLLFFGVVHLIVRDDFLKDNLKARIITIVVLFVAFSVRALLFTHETLDYTYFLADWTQYFRDNGGFFGLADVVGNYNLPYLYFLAFFSYLPISDLFLIKILSTIFDVILAFGVGKNVLFYTGSKTRQLISTLAVICLPTAILNGAAWAQCDSIFTAFAVWAFYYVLVNSPKKSMVFAAISLSFKVQAVFFLPIYVIFLLAKRVKITDCLVFPVAYIITLLPAVAFGHSFVDAITVYFRQVGGAVGSLNYNSASIFGFIPYNYEAEWLNYADYGGIALATALIYALMFVVLMKKNSCTDKTMLGMVTLLTLGIPFFLPHMHDRYFFLADVFTLTLAIVSPYYALPFFCCIFGSMLGYHAYLKNEFLLTMNFGAAAMVVAFIIICIYIYNSFEKVEEQL